MGAYFQWQNKSGLVQYLRFDVVKNELHEISTLITEHPVEEGANITDHARANLDAIKLDVFVTNAPIDDEDHYSEPHTKKRGAIQSMDLLVFPYEPPLAPTPGAVFGAIGGAINSLLNGKPQYSATVLQFSTPFNAVSDTYHVLRALRDTAQLITVITPMWDYDNMLIESVDLPRDEKTGDAGRFSISLRQIRLVQTQQVAQPVPTQVRATPKKEKGQKGPREEPKKKSAALALLNGAGFDIGKLLKGAGQ